jgi:hypothetical protein
MNRLFRDDSRSIATRVVVASVIMAFVGCNSARDDGRVAVSGQILLDGSPLDEGFVTLIPEAGGPAVTGPVEDGGFRIPRSEGPAPGPYRVEIDAVRPTGRIVEHPDLLGDAAEETENIVPSRYNRESTLRVEVVADGDNRFELGVTTRRSSNFVILFAVNAYLPCSRSWPTRSRLRCPRPPTRDRVGPPAPAAL